MNSPEGIIKKLGERGIACAIIPAENTVELGLLPGADPAAARELLYKALNGLEPFFSVFLKDLPCCFMPDAWDHALYRKRKGTRYTRIPACWRCSLHGLCPGLEKDGAFSGKAAKLLHPVLSIPSEIVIELTKK